MYCKRDNARLIDGRYSKDLRLCDDCIPKFIDVIDLEKLKEVKDA